MWLESVQPNASPPSAAQSSLFAGCDPPGNLFAEDLCGLGALQAKGLLIAAQPLS